MNLSKKVFKFLIFGAIISSYFSCFINDQQRKECKGNRKDSLNFAVIICNEYRSNPSMHIGCLMDVGIGFFERCDM